MLYFNAASHGMPDPSVYQAMIDFMQVQSESGQVTPTGNEELLKAKKAVASVLSARVDQLGFTSTTTEAWHAVVGSLDLAGKRVLITEHEWGDYYRLLSKRNDVELQVLPALDFTKPELSSWEELIDDDVAAIFVPLVTSVGGCRYPIEDIAALPRPAETKLIVDAAQALGQTEVNVLHLDCDAIISTCRKWLRGPRQTALFWINDTWGAEGLSVTASTLAPPDQNEALIVGLGAAVQCLLRRSVEVTEQQLITQADELRTWAVSNGIDIYGGANARSAVVSLDLAEASLRNVNRMFSREGVIGKIVDVSKVEPLQKNDGPSKKILRLSAHIYNSEEELEKLKEVILSAI